MFQMFISRKSDKSDYIISPNLIFVPTVLAETINKQLLPVVPCRHNRLIKQYLNTM